MPDKILKGVAMEKSIPVSTVEKYWRYGKREASAKGMRGLDMYKYAMDIVKRKLGIKSKTETATILRVLSAIEKASPEYKYTTIQATNAGRYWAIIKFDNSRVVGREMPRSGSIIDLAGESMEIFVTLPGEPTFAATSCVQKMRTVKHIIGVYAVVLATSSIKLYGTGNKLLRTIKIPDAATIFIKKHTSTTNEKSESTLRFI